MITQLKSKDEGCRLAAKNPFIKQAGIEQDDHSSSNEAQVVPARDEDSPS